MNKTTNYQLNQWERADRVLMEDFNADNAKIDAALTALAAERIRVGSFVGDGTKPRTVQLPWAPTFAVLFGQLNDVTAPFFLTQGHCQYVGQYNPGLDGSSAPQLQGASLTLKNWANEKDKTTHYILFR